MYRSNKHSMSSSLPGANTNVMKKKLIDNKATLGAAFPASESVSGWVTPVAAAESQEGRRKIYLQIINEPKKCILYFSA